MKQMGIKEIGAKVLPEEEDAWKKIRDGAKIDLKNAKRAIILKSEIMKIAEKWMIIERESAEAKGKV